MIAPCPPTSSPIIGWRTPRCGARGPKPRSSCCCSRCPSQAAPIRATGCATGSVIRSSASRRASPTARCRPVPTSMKPSAACRPITAPSAAPPAGWPAPATAPTPMPTTRTSPPRCRPPCAGTTRLPTPACGSPCKAAWSTSKAASRGPRRPPNSRPSRAPCPTCSRRSPSCGTLHRRGRRTACAPGDPGENARHADRNAHANSAHDGAGDNASGGS